MTNRFKDPTMRANYEGAVKAYEMQHRDLFWNGQRRGKDGVTHGSSLSTFFWRGFDNVGAIGNGGKWDAESKRTLVYAYYRAGQDCAKAAK
jgi:hypothetical protein